MQPIAAASPLAQAVQLKKAAADFEALLIGKVLESARPKADGAQAEYRAMADQQLARSIAASSPLGVAKLLQERRQ